MSGAGDALSVPEAAAPGGGFPFCWGQAPLRAAQPSPAPPRDPAWQGTWRGSSAVPRLGSPAGVQPWGGGIRDTRQERVTRASASFAGRSVVATVDLQPLRASLTTSLRYSAASSKEAWFLPKLRTTPLICTKRRNDRSERQMSELTPLNFLFNLTGSHVMHFFRFAGAGAGDCAGHGGLFHLPEDAQPGAGSRLSSAGTGQAGP